jgi:hypothetical protein
VEVASKVAAQGAFDGLGAYRLVAVITKVRYPIATSPDPSRDVNLRHLSPAVLPLVVQSSLSFCTLARVEVVAVLALAAAHTPPSTSRSTMAHVLGDFTESFLKAAHSPREVLRPHRPADKCRGEP